MQLQFVGKNIDITPALKAFATEKLQPLQKRFDFIMQINLVLHIENITHIAEATAHIKGAEIHARAENEDMYKAIEAMIDKLSTQLTKHKEKISEQH
ncbi:ribosome hibernation-promoting factor, HPF/YfiA family [Aquicella lusitana]|uniref:Ribosome hibernation promoting factor n=1 Tax=Aquicella lusitana TaxID=254246 RepID=A0A370GYS0_9COXI|nr:ribosome-associated translation inhibitor RaiA [Aquicella lusitana]RDI48779.1 SSU ribosomal protein S30P /sigma 54 modulation protein [Aquicella lusitana]VVC73207.1 Ribosome hibernation promoting factor [Aquicella lusitana]